MSQTPSFRRRVFLTLERSERADTLGRIVDMALIALIAINIGAVILETIEPVYQRHHTLFRIIEVVSVLVFTIEYILRLWAAVENEDYRDRRNPRWRYSCSPMAVIDLLAILPFYLAFLIPIDLRFLRMLRLLRVLKLTRYSSAMAMLLNVFRQEMHAFMAALWIMFVLLVIGASGAYWMEHEVQPEGFGSIPKAMWWAIITMATVGYGDVVPITTAGKIIGGFVAILGVGLAALPAGILASGLATQLQRNRETLIDQLREALDDGIIDAHEEAELEQLRKQLGLSRVEFDDVVREEREARKNAGPPCPHCGHPMSGKPRK